MLNPVFSVAHLRQMTHVFYKIAHEVRAAPGSWALTLTLTHKPL